MTARRSPIDAELMLHTEHVSGVEVQEIRRPPVGIQVLFLKLESHARRIFIALHTIVDGSHETIGSRNRAHHRLRKIMRKGRDSAQPWQVVAEEGDALR